MTHNGVYIKIITVLEIAQSRFLISLLQGPPSIANALLWLEFG